jgi:hypothetical protein
LNTVAEERTYETITADLKDDKLKTQTLYYYDYSDNVSASPDEGMTCPQ